MYWVLITTPVLWVCETDLVPFWYFCSHSSTLQSGLTVFHYDDVRMGAIASQITSLTIVYSTVYSNADQRKHQSSASLAFVWGIHRDRWIPRTKGQLRGKCFHLMTSSCDENDRKPDDSLTHLPLVPHILRQWTWTALVQVMAWCRTCDKPLPALMLIYCQLDP